MVGPSIIQLDLEWRPKENLLAHRLYSCPSEADCGLISKHRITMRWGIIFIKVKISAKIVFGGCGRWTAQHLQAKIISG